MNMLTQIMETQVTVCQIGDAVSALAIILALNMVARNHRWWLFYAATNITFISITIYKELPFLAVMGFFLGITGIRNYYIGKKKEESKKSMRYKNYEQDGEVFR